MRSSVPKSAPTGQSGTDKILVPPLHQNGPVWGSFSFRSFFSFVQMAIENNHSVSWMTAHRTQMSLFNWIDLFITLFFIVELAFKIILAPRKWFFIKNSFIDILSILPIFRMFRLARTTRLLRVVRLFKAMRGGRMLKSDLIKQKTHILFRTENTAMITYLLLSVLWYCSESWFLKKESTTASFL